MPTDLDRRCWNQQRELETRVARLDQLSKRASGSRRQKLLTARNESIIELHEMKRAHASYDQRLDEAFDDPTGQDLDSFPFSE